MTGEGFHNRCQRLVDQATPFVCVTMVQREGSVPQDVGGKMVVTEHGLAFGTVGGGRIEAKAIQHAQAMLAAGTSTDLVHWNLTTDVGMTCGGRLRLFFEVTDRSAWSIAIFGAGHVAQSLTRLLATLPCQVTCIDSRADWLGRLAEPTQRILSDDLPRIAGQLPERTFVLSMTQGHSHDFPILEQIWKSGRRFPFVGVIGSNSKAAALRRELRQAGMPDGALSFHCPIGLPLGTNHPGEIAVSIAAQLIQVRDSDGAKP